MRRLLLILGLSIALFAAVGLLLGGLASRQILERTGAGTPHAIEQARRSAQAAALRRYLERRSQGTLLPASDVTIAVREDFLQKVIKSSMPFRQEFANGRYVARLDSVRVDLQDGLALVTLTGRGALASDSALYADLVLEGRLGIAGINDSTGQLTPRLEITDIRVQRAGPTTLRALTNPAVRYFGLQKVQEWNTLQSTFHLPLKIEQDLMVPAVTGDIDLPEVHLPLAIRLASVISLENRLVVSLRLLPESDSSVVGPEAPLRSWSVPDHTPRGLRFDQETIDALGDSVRSFAARDTLWRAVLLTDRDLVIITPRSVLAELAYRMARRYRRGADVDFRPGIHETIDETIKVKFLGANVTAGHILVDIHVNHLKGRLETPGEPRVRFQPPDGLDVTLPVRISSGGGVATFAAKWDPSKMASVICHEFETKQVLSGSVRPLTHEAHATIRFTLVDGKIRGEPTLRRDKLRLSFDLDERSWRKVRDVFVEQNKFGKCGIAMKPDSMVARLRRLGTKGVAIRLPADLLPDFELPVSFADVYEQEQVRVVAVAFRPELLVRPEYLRFGVDGDLRVELKQAPEDSTRVMIPPPTPVVPPRLP